MTAGPTPPGGRAEAGTLRKLIARDGRAVLAGGALTLVVQLGVYVLGVAGGAPRMQAALATLAASVVWVALAAPVLGATGRDALGALLRGGIVADASAVTLLVLWLGGPHVTFAAAVKVYCILAAMSLAGIAACRLGRSSAGRHILAVVAAAAILTTAASPFWIGGAIRTAPPATARRIVATGVYANPFYCVTAALSEQTRFVWHQASVMYRLTRIGDYAPAPAACWYASAAIHAAAAALLAGVGALVHRRRRRR